MRRRLILLSLIALAALAALAAPAGASASSSAPPDSAAPLFVDSDLNTVPPGFLITPARALEIAERSPAMQAIHRHEHPLHWTVLLWVRNHYEVIFYYQGRAVADQTVGPNGNLGPLLKGALIGAPYARGHYGNIFDSLWVEGAFTLMFLLPLLLLRRRSWLDRFDIAVLLTFGASYWLFNTTHLEAGVWLFYPPLLYILVRMLIRGFRPRRPSEPLEVRLPTAVLVVGLGLLIAARIVVSLHPPGVLDVGTASVIGAYKILHGQSIYYYSLGHGDTYGPLNYLAYVPFVAIWSHSWGYLFAARAATITFDLLTIAGLITFGWRLRRGRTGLRLGLLLAWLFAACPCTLLGMEKSTNDGLIALIVVLVLLTLTSPLKRGALVAVGAATKWFPAILLPLIAVGQGDEKPGSVRKTLAAFVIVFGASIALFLPSGGLLEVWNHTLGFQLSRPDVFSIWALHPTLAPIKDLFEAFAVILAVLVAFRPRGRRTPAQVAALAAALTIAVQLPALHWFYLYIVWFLPLQLIAVLCTDGPVAAEAEGLADASMREEGDAPEQALAGVA
jgi:hypothetical protein